jgi:hypothetical protein
MLDCNSGQICRFEPPSTSQPVALATSVAKGVPLAFAMNTIDVIGLAVRMTLKIL